MVNWGAIWDGASRGGGVNGYAQRLALALRDLDHEVFWLSSGSAYAPGGPEGKIGPIRTIRHPDWLGIRAFEIVNSPIIAPAALQADRAEEEIANTDLEVEFVRVLGAIGPDVLHLHNIEGLTAGCLLAASRLNPRPKILYSLHNYHTLTPQGYLPKRAVEIAEELAPPNLPAAEAEKRRRADIAERPPAELSAIPDATQMPHTPAKRSSLLSWLRTESIEPPPPPAPSEPAAPEDPLARCNEPLSPDGPDSRGQTAWIGREHAIAFRPTPEHPTWQPIDQTAEQIPADSDATRRLAMVDALNACDTVLAVSEFVREKYAAEGVDEHRLLTMPIGTATVELAATHRELVFAPPPIDPVQPRPLRLVYTGFDHPYKGLHVLADALELMSPEQLRRIALGVFAHAGHRTEWRFRRLEPRLASLRYGHAYLPHDVPWIMGGADAAIVPSIWFDNAPQTVLEAFACGVPVVGSRLGGIADMVQDGVNGLLFRGNDRGDLARVLARLLDEHDLAPRLRAGVRPPKSMGEHAREMGDLYARVLSSPSLEEAITAR